MTCDFACQLNKSIFIMPPKRKLTKKRKPLSQLTIDESQGRRKRSKGVEEDESPPTCRRRAGTVNHIILKNFMCHSLLEVDFKQNISMVIGKNGSGKSALITALIVGLGGKASLTNRGSSVKGFVKVGRSSATIEIQLCNEGPMAYRPRVYGKTITVIRNLSASGGGSYRVKSAMGEVISTQAKEVTNITANLNIQVDNPICLLTQDTSRNFLSSNDPKNKFALFMKATKLEALDAEYKIILNNKKDCVRLLADRKNNFAHLQEEIRRLKKKIDGHQNIVILRERKIALQREIKWAEVRDTEEELSIEQQKVDKIQKKLEEFQVNADRKNEEIEEIQQQIATLDRQMSELKDQLAVQKRPQTEANRTMEELQTEHGQVKRRKQTILMEIDSKVKDTEYLQQEIANANDNMSRVEQQKKEKMGRLQKMQQNLKDYDDQLQTTRNDLFQIKSDIARKGDDERGYREEIRGVEAKIGQEEVNLQNLQRESGNSLILYGRNIPKIKQMIQRYKDQFTHEPKGPLGSYMKLKDKKWAVAAEGFIGAGNLCAFIVDNQKDGKLLQNIFARCLEGERPPTIITSKFLNRKHDVRRNLVQAPRDCMSLYEAVIIDDPVVSNCIVDQQSIENILLIPSNERAMELMSEQAHVPHNCRQGVTIRGDRYFPDPHYKTYATSYTKARFLQLDTKAHIQVLQQTIMELKDKKKNIYNQTQALRQDMNNQQQRQKELEDKIRRVTLLKQKINSEYDNLNNQADPEVHDLNTLESELHDIKNTIAEKKALLGQVDEEMRTLKTKIVAQEQKMTKFKSSTKALEERIWVLQEEIKERQAKERQLNTTDGFDKQRLAELQKKVDGARVGVVSKQTEVDKKSTDARKLGERPDDLRRVPEISTDVQQISIEIARIETESDDIVQVRDRYQELVEKNQSVSEIMQTLYIDLEELSKAVERRKRHYKLTENFFVTVVKHSFKKILQHRQFSGSLEINMDQKKLDLVVIPQQGSQGMTTTSNLSGGERSFSTVAFLYALWQCMDFPFYFLDEFDVYMDKLNRTKVIDTLLHHANSKPDLQFVFLTPQDVSFITQSISILRLDDPERFNL